jgi:hypothetical protein
LNCKKGKSFSEFTEELLDLRLELKDLENKLQKVENKGHLQFFILQFRRATKNKI